MKEFVHNKSKTSQRSVDTQYLYFASKAVQYSKKAKLKYQYKYKYDD